MNRQDLTTHEDSATDISPVSEYVSANATGMSVFQIRQWRWAGTRLLVLLWCLYLFGVWLVSLQVDSSIPASHWMLWCMIFGLMVVWPAIQLSQLRSIDPKVQANPMQPVKMPEPTGVVFVQWLCLSLVNQSVLWPLQITAGWNLTQCLWINAALLAWSLLVGLFIALGKRSNESLHRTGALMICVGLFVGEPILEVLLGRAWPMFISPISTLHQLLVNHVTGGVVTHITAVALAGCVGWGILGIIQASPSES